MCLNFAAPSVSPMNVSLIQNTTNTLTFSWDEIPCESRGGQYIVYEYYLESSPPQNGTTSFTNITLYNLTPCTAYRFTVQGRNEKGTGPKGVSFGLTMDESK